VQLFDRCLALMGAFLFLGSCQATPGGDVYESAEQATAQADWDEAAGLWYRLHLAEGVKREQTYVEAARAFHANGDSEGACALIRRGLRDFPRSESLYDLHSHILEDCGFSRAAERSYAELVRIAPNHLDGLIGLGRVRMDLDLERAAEEPLRRAVALDHACLEPQMHLARVRQTRGDPVGAYGWYTSAIQLGARDPLFLLDAAGVADEEVVVQADPAAREKALVWLDLILAVEPQVTLAHFLRGTHLEALGRQDEATLSYLRAVETDPSCLSALTRLAWIFADEGDSVRTREFVGRALEIEEDPTRREELEKLLEEDPQGSR